MSFEELLMRFLKGVVHQCDKHFPDCQNYPFHTTGYYKCSVRQFGQYLTEYSFDYDLKKMGRTI